jgi:hypothetical protein
MTYPNSPGSGCSPLDLDSAVTAQGCVLAPAVTLAVMLDQFFLTAYLQPFQMAFVSSDFDNGIVGVEIHR